LSDNWVVQNLQNALETWNEKLAEIWQLITTTPQSFKGGGIWAVIVNINGAVQAIGLALLVLFFVVGMVRTCGSFSDVKKPEHAVKLFIRFALAKAGITYGMELMLALFNIVQVVANALAWILVAPVLDIVIYAEPVNKVFTQGVTAFVANVIIIGILGTLLLVAYSKVGAKSGSLSKED